jgi:hypothetical protein
MAPTSHADLCTRAEACLRSFAKDGAYLEGYSLECDSDWQKDLAEAYSKPVPAPAESGVLSTSLVAFAAIRDGNSYGFESKYLVADFADGACLVDEVFGWDRHSLYPDTTFDAQWTPGGQRVSVWSHQVLHEALDQEELATEESDVRSDLCQRITYDVQGGRFTRVAESSTEGSCDGTQ